MATIHIDENKPLGRIAPEIYGHFSEHLRRCIYGGIFVKPDSGIPNVNGMRTDAAEALKEIRMPVLRWPGGCFVNEYHWKDGIGPKESRKRMVNTHWGGVVEDSSFGPHKFFEIGGGRTAPPSAPEVRPLSGTGRRWGRSGSRFCT